MSCGSGVAIAGSCGYPIGDATAFDVTVAYSGQQSTSLWMCTALNRGAVARTIQYGITCHQPVAASAAVPDDPTAADSPDALPRTPPAAPTITVLEPLLLPIP